MATLTEPVITRTLRIRYELWVRFQHVYEAKDSTQRDATEDAIEQWCEREERRLVKEAEKEEHCE